MFQRVKLNTPRIKHTERNSQRSNLAPLLPVQGLALTSLSILIYEGETLH